MDHGDGGIFRAGQIKKLPENYKDIDAFEFLKALFPIVPQSAFSVRFIPAKTQVFQGFPPYFLGITGLSGFGSYEVIITFLERTKEDVIAFLKDREQFPEAYKAPLGWYSGGYDPRSHHDIPPIVVKDMHVYYKELFLRFCNAYAEFMGECELNTFITGFRLGARFMMDIFLSDDAPFESFLEG